MTPAVSVLLPVRNGLPYLTTALASILTQTFTDFELLVVDDGSADGTRAALEDVHDPRVRVLSSDGAGLGAALNLGLAQARGAYLARHDADDWSAPDRLERQWQWLEHRRDVDVLATAASFADASGVAVESAWTRTVHAQWDSAVAPEAIAALMPLTCCLFHATVMARTEVLRAAGGYDPSTVPAEDYDLWLRLLPAHRFARLPERLYTVRTYPESFSARRRDDQLLRVIEAKLRALRRWHPGIPQPARLALPADDRGAAAFRAAGPALGFFPMEVADRDADVVAVTDFRALGREAARLCAGGDYVQVGNLFVRRAHVDFDGRVTAAPAQPTCS